MSINPQYFIEVDINSDPPPGPAVSFGRLLGVFPHELDPGRVDGPFTTLAELEAGGFTAGATPAINAWGATVFAQDKVVDEVLVGRVDDADANITAALNAIESEAGEDGWYHQTIYSRANADILAAAAWAQTRRRRLILQTQEADLANGVIGNIGSQLKALSYTRTSLLYHHMDAQYADGAWASRCGAFSLDSPDGAGIWAYKRLIGVTPSNVSSGQATNIWAENANVYGVSRGRAFTSHGTSASGDFIDIITTNDWLQTRWEEATLDLQLEQEAKVPYDQSGIDLAAERLESIISLGKTANHLNRSEGAVNTIVVPRFKDIPANLRAQRKAIYRGTITYAGAIQSIELIIEARF